MCVRHVSDFREGDCPEGFGGEFEVSSGVDAANSTKNCCVLSGAPFGTQNWRTRALGHSPYPSSHMGVVPLAAEGGGARKVCLRMH